MKFLPTASSFFERMPRSIRRHSFIKLWMWVTGEASVQLVRIRDNNYAYVDMSDGFLRLIVIDQDFENEFFALADRIFAKGGTFIDVGANYGLLSFGLAGRHGSLIDFHLFEPNSTLIASIESTLRLYPNIRMFLNQAAVSNYDGTVRFEINEGQTGASHISNNDQGVSVNCITLDGYIESVGIRKIELLKLDVEGYELFALRGAQRALTERIIQAVYFEYFEKWLVRFGSPRDLIDFLKSVGFETCFCRVNDFDTRSKPTHTLGNSDILLLPISGYPMPPMTDLIAVPSELLIAL